MRNTPSASQGSSADSPAERASMLRAVFSSTRSIATDCPTALATDATREVTSSCSPVCWKSVTTCASHTSFSTTRHTSPWVVTVVLIHSMAPALLARASSSSARAPYRGTSSACKSLTAEMSHDSSRRLLPRLRPMFSHSTASRNCVRTFSSVSTSAHSIVLPAPPWPTRHTPLDVSSKLATTLSSASRLTYSVHPFNNGAAIGSCARSGAEPSSSSGVPAALRPSVAPGWSEIKRPRSCCCVVGATGCTSVLSFGSMLSWNFCTIADTPESSQASSVIFSTARHAASKAACSVRPAASSLARATPNARAASSATTVLQQITYGTQPTACSACARASVQQPVSTTRRSGPLVACHRTVSAITLIETLSIAPCLKKPGTCSPASGASP
mmetsp:Transcript_22141/g.52958  ORF Transcript_22141/g.52958 Transcript_22141/m.52958 type:complete len:387 (+) Transcript_22141:1368-2528(+)